MLSYYVDFVVPTINHIASVLAIIAIIFYLRGNHFSDIKEKLGIAKSENRLEHVGLAREIKIDKNIEKIHDDFYKGIVFLKEHHKAEEIRLKKHGEVCYDIGFHNWSESIENDFLVLEYRYYIEKQKNEQFYNVVTNAKVTELEELLIERQKESTYHD